jgi:hypothetical protein
MCDYVASKATTGYRTVCIISRDHSSAREVKDYDPFDESIYTWEERRQTKYRKCT